MKKISPEIISIIFICLAFFVPPWRTGHPFRENVIFATEWSFLLSPPDSILSSVDVQLLGLELIAIYAIYLLLKKIDASKHLDN
jgi:hypothetical protein